MTSQPILVFYLRPLLLYYTYPPYFYHNQGKHRLGLTKKEIFSKTWEPEYQLLPNGKIFLKQCQAYKKKFEWENVYLATDYDREGEVIASHIKEELEKKNKNINVIEKDLVSIFEKQGKQLKRKLIMLSEIYFIFVLCLLSIGKSGRPTLSEKENSLKQTNNNENVQVQFVES